MRKCLIVTAAKVQKNFAKFDAAVAANSNETPAAVVAAGEVAGVTPAKPAKTERRQSSAGDLG